MPLSLEEIFSPVLGQLKSVDLEMRQAVTTGFPEMDRCGRYIVDGGGKRIRAALVIACSGLFGVFPENISRLAAGAEMVHAATLLHDDVIDNAKTRRGRDTVSRLWNVRTAVLFGDFLLAKALDIAAALDRPDLYTPLSNSAKDMVYGEFLQNTYSDISSVSKKIYLDIIQRKTGGFMGSCCYIGAAFSGLPKEKCSSLQLFGSELGAVFQIIDDTLDYTSSESSTGKDQGTDYFNGKVTLPVLCALETLDSQDRERLIKCFRAPSDEGWMIVRRLVEETGAVERTVCTARDMALKASDRVLRFPDSECRKILIDLSRFIVERVY